MVSACGLNAGAAGKQLIDPLHLCWSLEVKLLCLRRSILDPILPSVWLSRGVCRANGLEAGRRCGIWPWEEDPIMLLQLGYTEECFIYDHHCFGFVDWALSNSAGMHCVFMFERCVYWVQVPIDYAIAEYVYNRLRLFELLLQEAINFGMPSLSRWRWVSSRGLLEAASYSKKYWSESRSMSWTTIKKLDGISQDQAFIYSWGYQLLDDLFVPVCSGMKFSRCRSHAYSGAAALFLRSRWTRALVKMHQKRL